MASLKSSTDASNRDGDDGGGRKKSTTFPPHLDALDGQGLPEGSTLFREVMAELHPTPHLDPHPAPHESALKSPSSRRRKISSHAKHVHYETDDVQGHKAGHKAGHRDAGAARGEGEEEEEAEGKQILHGKCHCYFVEKGNVTGLADKQCHHEHRHYPPSPATSPKPSRRAGALTRPRTPTPSPPADTGPGRARSKSHTHAPHPHPPSSHHYPTFLSPELEEFRARSHSDTAAMARLSTSKKASFSSSTSPTLAASSYGRSSPNARARTSPRRAGGARGGSGASPSPNTSPARARTPRGSPDRPLPGARSGGGESAKIPMDERQLAEGAAPSLQHYAPPPILVQDASVPESESSAEGERRARKISAHAVSSDQLHYLYHQYLHHGSGLASGQ